MKLVHLDGRQHLTLAAHLRVAEEHLLATTAIVNRAPYTDAILRILRELQCRVIEPLQEEWYSKEWGGENPYQSTNYAV